MFHKLEISNQKIIVSPEELKDYIVHSCCFAFRCQDTGFFESLYTDAD